jgi:hypothetical protein
MHVSFPKKNFPCRHWGFVPRLPIIHVPGKSVEKQPNLRAVSFMTMEAELSDLLWIKSIDHAIEKLSGMCDAYGDRAVICHVILCCMLYSVYSQLQAKQGD